jgi:glycosyltransferase involved in cell wall biosynthesis
MASQRLLYVDDIPTPYRLGVFRRFAARFDGVFRVAFLAAGEPGRDWTLSFTGLDVEILKARQWRPSRQRTPFSYKWNPDMRRCIAAFRPSVAAVSVYIHPSVQFATHVFRCRGIPYGMASESSFLQGGRGTWRFRAKRALLGPMVRALRFGLPCGSQAEAYLRALGADHQPMFRFPNTPDTQAVQAAATTVGAPGEAAAFLQRLGIDPQQPLALFVGRLIPAKRPQDLLDAYARLSPELRARATLVLAGDGELRGTLEQRALAIRPGRVAFPGWISPADVHRLMALAHVFVLPSGHEPWGAVVNESMAAGTPVIASDRVGAAYDMILEGRTGWTFPVGRAHDLALLLDRCLGPATPVPAMRAACRHHAERYGAEFAAESLLGAVRSVLP